MTHAAESDDIDLRATRTGIRNDGELLSGGVYRVVTAMSDSTRMAILATARFLHDFTNSRKTNPELFFISCTDQWNGAANTYGIRC